MIIRSLDSDKELTRFIENATSHGHKLDSAIAAYSHKIDTEAERKLSEKLRFHAVNINDARYCHDQFHRRGITGTATKTLLESPLDTRSGLVPYGYNRTIVVLEALLRGADILIFADSDVYPATLKKTNNGPTAEEIDYFGTHLKHLNSGSQVTTGEYSGYNILPKATFDGMEDLLAGLQKTEMLEYWQNSATHKCLTIKPDGHKAKASTKILGGNLGIKLSAFTNLPPFFSTYYTQDGETFLSRGEDTVLGMGIAKNGIACTDVGLYPLHDTYKDYPAEPDLKNDKTVQERFYYACTGWVGRNPFLNYLQGSDIQATKEHQRESLERGLKALAKYTKNPKYNSVIRNFETSWDSLAQYINEYERLLEAWDEVIGKIMKQGVA